MGESYTYYNNVMNLDGIVYRHVHIPKELLRILPRNRLLSEKEWRSLGIQQSHGWVHYMIHSPERHILLFRRPLKKDDDAGEKRQ
ncbi:unnamed protein product [Thelazia callipaeda]|uniref:Cyclin-dependent kinases regulatory subunit n=1 Tax=Thelazia callipaeda TaxID=103827 RepID=A0A0N5CMD0_THECL|nr:unnamed protein product [Thelazia callipaeda]